MYFLLILSRTQIRLQHAVVPLDGLDTAISLNARAHSVEPLRKPRIRKYQREGGTGVPGIMSDASSAALDPLHLEERTDTDTMH